VTWALQLKVREAGDFFGMGISVSHAPSTYALEIHAVQMSVRVF